MTLASSSSQTTSQVRVGVRVRPLTSQEVSQGGKGVVDVYSPMVGIGERRFTYDSVFDSHVTQSDLYETVAPPLLGSFLDGYNATIMAYGQTGSGKTFTMGSEAHTEGESASYSGLIPRFMSDIFELLERKKMTSDAGTGDENNNHALLDYRVSASFLEVYGEDVHDLLDEDRKTLPIREDSEGGVICVGLKNQPVAGADDALNVLHVGTLNRTTAATLMNLTSSRSHAVFTIRLEQTIRTKSGGADVDVATRSCFTFVDLAGSERMKKTGAEGERAREGIKINEGLLALGNVINALADDERISKEKKIHVPYRQSKLTRLLQDALGGNSQTLFLACVSPSNTNASETLSTLHYANRARNIKNAPTKNVDATVLEIQRLNSLNYVLQCELVKERFDTSSSPVSEASVADKKIGHASESLWKRKDVQEYIQLLYQAADEQRGDTCSGTKISVPQNTSGSNRNTLALPAPTVPSVSHGEHGGTILDATMTKFDDALLDEVNPDEEMAILDHLLDLQHQDNEFDKELQKGEEELKQVEGQLAEQESMLLQLRERIKVYHNLKAQYEVLMTEVQNLETEKSQLADQLEKATADPSKGCSRAIKRKLEKVEHSLARARTETRKHQQMYRKAEQEAQKCKTLERKITDLKQGKVSLIKKQRAAAAKHREYTEAKTREITALKKKERRTGKKVSKMETEIRIHKANLEKRNAYCDKLKAKQKQTESHLMRLLLSRKRDLRGPRRRATVAVPSPGRQLRGAQEDSSFAPKTEEISSMKFLLEKMVSDRVANFHTELQYKERVAENNELLRDMVREVKNLMEAKKKLDEAGDDDPELEGVVRDHEQNIEELELKQELVSADLEVLQTKLPEMDESPRENSRSEESALKMLSTLGGPVVRTLLWEILAELANLEFEHERQTASIKRKDSALQSFESEVEALNNKVAALTNDVAQRRKVSLSGEDPVDTIRRLQTETSSLNDDLQKSQEEKENLLMTVSDMQGRMTKIELEHSVAKEKLTVAEVIISQSKKNHEADVVVEKLQHLWEELGVSSSDRDCTTMQIQTCLEDTCKQKLEEASSRRARTLEEIEHLRNSLLSMYKALGKPFEDCTKVSAGERTLLQQREALQEQERRIRPSFQSAVERRLKIAKDVNILTTSMGPLDEPFSDLAKLVEQNHCFRGLKRKHHDIATPEKRFRRTVALTPASQLGRKERASMLKNVEGMVNALEAIEMKGEAAEPSDVEGTALCNKGEDSSFPPPGSLEDMFLERCEQKVTKLRLLKSDILVRNTQLRDAAANFSKEMHLVADNVLSLSMHSIKKRLKVFPGWWNTDCVTEVCRIITSKDGVVGATKAFSKHLELIHESLSSISQGRRSLSKALQGVVEHAHKTLLKTVEGEVDANEAYSSFHDALFRLPPLSKEHINACISEMNALVLGVDAMTQSEIEALTVVWEALNISASERARFWGGIEQSTTAHQMKTSSPFDAALQPHSIDSEEWVISAVRDATKTNRELSVRLLKLEEIHKEVEKLRSKQDAKSKIISLDSELRILNAKLADFEDKKCNKQRLLTKKTNSSTLLKEERFRKQMQGKFSSKLEQLGVLLRSWSEEEGTVFDSSILSEEVRLLLENSEHMHTWVENRTAFMHLRTVKASGKRTGDGTPIRKKVRENGAEFGTPRSTSRGAPQAIRSKAADSPLRNPSGKSSAKSRKGSSATPSKRRLPRADPSSRIAKSTASRDGTTKKRHQPQNRSKSPVKAKFRRKATEAASGRTPLSPNTTPTRNTPTTKSSMKPRQSTILPFGHLLSEESSPMDKENSIP